MRQLPTFFLLVFLLSLSHSTLADVIDLESVEAANKVRATKIAAEAMTEQEKAGKEVFSYQNAQLDWIKQNLGAQFIRLFAKKVRLANNLQLTWSLNEAQNNSLADKAFLNDPNSKFIESDEAGWFVNRVNISTLSVIKNPVLDNENTEFKTVLELSNTLSRLSPENLSAIVDAPEEEADLNARMLNSEVTTSDYAKVESLTDALVKLAKVYLLAAVLGVLAIVGFRKLKRRHEESKLERIDFIDDEAPATTA